MCLGTRTLLRHGLNCDTCLLSQLRLLGLGLGLGLLGLVLGLRLGLGLALGLRLGLV